MKQVLLLPSWLIYIAFSSVAIYSAENGIIDRHFRDVDVSKIQTFAFVSQHDRLRHLMLT